MEINLSQTQIQNTAQRGGSLFSTMLGLARPLIKPALGALASAGLSFGAEKVLKKIFGNGFGPKEIELYKLVQKMTPTQKKEAEQYLVGQGFVQGGSAQYGGLLGMLASLGVPLALDLVRKIIGKVCKHNHHHAHENDEHHLYHHLLKVKECKFNLHLFSELGLIIII